MRVFLSLYMLSCAVYTRGEPAMPSQSEAFPLRDDTEILPAGEDMSKLTGMRQGNKIGGIFNEMNFDKMSKTINYFINSRTKRNQRREI